MQWCLPKVTQAGLCGVVYERHHCTWVRERLVFPSGGTHLMSPERGEMPTPAHQEQGSIFRSKIIQKSKLRPPRCVSVGKGAYLSLIPGLTWWKGRADSWKLSSDLRSYHGLCKTHPYIKFFKSKTVAERACFLSCGKRLVNSAIQS